MLIPVLRPSCGSPAVIILVLALALAPAGIPALAAARPRVLAQATRHHHAHAPVGSASGYCPDANLLPSSQNLDRISLATLCLINRQRHAHGRTRLRRVAVLERAAAAHSQDMVARDYFEHVSPSGVTPIDRLRQFGYLRPPAGFNVAENLAWGTGIGASPAAIVKAWMNSPVHRVNILAAGFRDGGIGVSGATPAFISRLRGATYTEEFGVTR